MFAFYYQWIEDPFSRLEYSMQQESCLVKKSKTVNTEPRQNQEPDVKPELLNAMVRYVFFEAYHVLSLWISYIIKYDVILFKDRSEKLEAYVDRLYE